MRTTSKMGLASWDQLEDNYNYAQLAGNWQKIDFHDHSPGRGVPIAAGGLSDGAVTREAIAAGVVGGQHLAPGLIQDLALNAGTNIGRGYFGHAASQSISASLSAPAFLPTPDRVLDVQVQDNGIIEITYQALWRIAGGTGSVTGYAVLMISQPPYTTWTPLPISTPNVTTAADKAQITATSASFWSPLSTGSGGLVSNVSRTSDAAETSTGQAVGVGGGSTALASQALNGVLVASTTNIDPNSPPLIIDGIVLNYAVGTGVMTSPLRILLKDQANPIQNGIWNYNVDLAGVHPMTRPSDYNSALAISPNSTVSVSLGDANAGKTYAIQTPTTGTITVGTTATTWGLPSSSLAVATAGASIKAFAPAGTYGIGVAYATSGGGSIVSAQNRHLWVKAENYV